MLRFSRLYPLHLATLLLVAALQVVYRTQAPTSFIYTGNSLKNFGLQLLMVHSWLGPTYSFDGPNWSISIEVLVYVVFFVLLRFVGASALVNVGVVALWYAGRRTGLESLVFDAIVLFYVGGLAAIGLRRLEGTRLDRPSAWLAGAASVVGLLVFRRAPIYSPHFTLALTLYLPVLVYALAGNVRPRNARVQRGVEVAGNLTYASYLTHFPVQLLIVLACNVIGVAVPARSVGLLVGFLGGVLLLSFAVFRWFEAPAQGLLRQRLRRPPASAALPRAGSDGDPQVEAVERPTRAS